MSNFLWITCHLYLIFRYGLLKQRRAQSASNLGAGAGVPVSIPQRATSAVYRGQSSHCTQAPKFSDAPPTPIAFTYKPQDGSESV